MNAERPSSIPANGGLPIADLFGSAHAIDRVELSGVGGFRSGAVLTLGGGLNVLYGASGSGRTRLLRTILACSGDNPRPLTRVAAPMFSSNLSEGQQVYMTAKWLLSILPPDGCLLMDGVLSLLDDDHRRMLVHSILATGKQSVLTISERELSGIQRICGSQDARFIDMKDLEWLQ